MRLICPNCGAQYDVDDSVIPENGRDVQCSNCGHTWYQRPASKSGEEPDQVAAEDHSELSDEAPAEQSFENLPEAEIQPAVEEASDPVADATDEADVAVEDDADDSSTEDSEPEESVPEPPQPENRERAQLDADVANVLREEADRETAQRNAESNALETQTDLGLDGEATTPDPEISERMARLRGLDEDLSEPETALGAGQRKDLLPDIEEINSTLTASAEDAEEGSEQEVQEIRQRHGFRRGFAATIIVFAVLMLVYILAPRIADAVPQLTPTLSAYVDWVNALRASIDGGMQVAVDKITALVSQINGDDAG